MIDIKRRTPRFNVKFKIQTGDIEGKGINISQGGFGFLTENKIELEGDISFDALIPGFIFSNKTYSIKAKLLYSHSTKTHRDLFYNGFQFVDLDEKSKDNLYELLEDIRKFEKSKESIIESKTLADFNYYPSNDLFFKAQIFFIIIFLKYSVNYMRKMIMKNIRCFHIILILQVNQQAY